jgi:hypothetical protein
MTQDRRQAALENLIYLIIWMILFVAPILGFKYGNDTSIVWSDVFRSWKMLAPFFVLFLVNNYLLIPYFLLRKKSWIYLLFILILSGLVFLMNPLPMRRFLQNNRQGPERMGEWYQPERRGRQPFQQGDSPRFPQDSLVTRLSEPKSLSQPDSSEYLRQSASQPEGGRRFGMNEPPPGMGIRRNPAMYDPYFFFMSPLFKFLMMAILVIGLNVAIKLMFRLIREGQRVKELEKQKFQSELEYLKYQINPHFFMNTLNNIHALIDIDAEKAKETVLDLSKMMRYVLYDTEQSTLPLEKEIRFLTNYVDLMKLRYTDQVEINIRFPEDIPDVQVPPLLFISFLENAFKHGVSYRHKSFIRFSVRVAGNKLEYEITNSKFEVKSAQSENGIGLENVKKRLRLLYNDDYTLTICDEKEKFKVLLIIPV